MRILGVTIASQVLDHGQLQFPGYFHHLFASKHHLPALRGCDIHCTTAAFKWGNQGNRNIEYLCLHLFICYFASALQLIQKTRTWWWSLGLQAAKVNSNWCVWRMRSQSSREMRTNYCISCQIKNSNWCVWRMRSQSSREMRTNYCTSCQINNAVQFMPE